jgi:putative ABC transport system permease protein
MHSKLRLFQLAILRSLLNDPLRTCLTIFAVSLGVAVVIAIELAGTAAAGSFRASLESLAGDADLEISAIGGVREEVLGELVRLPYPLEFTPRLEGASRVEPAGTPVTVVGLDLIAEGSRADGFGGTPEDVTGENAIWTSPMPGAKPGATMRLSINGRTQEYRVRGVLRDTSQERIVLMDIGQAQVALDKVGLVDRIEVRFPEGGRVEDWQSLLKTALPDDATVSPAGAGTDEHRKMLAAFRWNLRMLSYISLIVGAFLIYNTISVSVVRRRTEIGIFRALGATRFEVLGAFLVEAAIIGTAGALLGVALGRLMSEGAVKLLASTVDALYVSSTPAPIALTPAILVLALTIGVLVSLTSAFAPALEAARVSPAEAMSSGAREHKTRVRMFRDVVVATVLAVGAAAASQMQPVDRRPVFGYVAALLLIAASAMATPALVAAASRLWRSGIRAVLGVEAMLAARSLAASLNRTSVLAGALSTAVAMMAAVGIMVGSFRETVAVWLHQQLRADLYIRPFGGRGAVLPPDFAQALEAVPGVAAVEPFRVYDISFNGLPALLGAGPTRIVQRFGKTRFLPGQNRTEILDRLARGDYVIVSEPFASKHRVKAGDTITLPLGGGLHRFAVLGVYYDYSNERGYVIMDRDVLLKYLPDQASTSVAVYIAEGVDPARVRTAVDRAAAQYSVIIHSNRTLRMEALRIFDRTFAITYALEAVAVAVAVMGIAGALLALVMDRRREFGVLRFLGAATGQIRRLILFEAGLLGLLANLIGFVLGALLSLILIFVINKQSFGWTIQFHWPVGLLLGGLTLVYVATVMAGLYPARIAVRLNPIEVVHEE